MLVDKTYQIGEKDELAHELLLEHWDKDQIYETNQPAAGPSQPFHFGFLPSTL